MNLLRGFTNNKNLVIFTCISGLSFSSFFALSIWLEDNNNRVSTALTLFFAATGYWAKTKYELENKSQSVQELEDLINSTKDHIEELFRKSLDRLEIETSAANKIQDEKFETFKTILTELAANLTSHLNSVGHIETEKRISDLAANTKVLQLQILQVGKEYETKRLLEGIVNDLHELKCFLESQGFKPKR
jgi:hypothetical protein